MLCRSNATAVTAQVNGLPRTPGLGASGAVRGAHSQQSLARLRTAFDDEAPCKTTIYKWFAEFKRDLVNLSNEFRDGRPSTGVNNINIDAVRCIFETDRHVTHYEI
ncbi:hypothetical protein EVAR_59093_1 [Eumeta japonica]|uniref:Mos1 transposase HTH domain-containing protein n=1 Tax=Eumeta variegata TaxID=151549 RepID=A0A4C1YWB8_EUMVA|nr:hypothetical protein EVAR_59093_1 [Eumeta japonica]